MIEQLDGSRESDATDVEMDLFSFMDAEDAKQMAKQLNLAQIGDSPNVVSKAGL